MAAKATFAEQPHRTAKEQRVQNSDERANHMQVEGNQKVESDRHGHNGRTERMPRQSEVPRVA